MSDFLDRIFPLWRIRNVMCFYILSAVYNAWMMAGIWVFFWGKFMSNTQIGISDAFTFAVGFIVELPSGVFADVIGRKKAIVIGNIFLAVGNFCVSLSSSFLGITAWYLLWTVGYAFQSGATEALVYDSVRRAGHEKEWHRVIATATVVGKTSALISTALGGLLFTVWFRLPYLAAAGVGVIGIIAALLLQDIAVARHGGVWSLSTYLNQIKDGISTLVRPNVLPISLLGLSVMGIGYMYNWGLLRPLTAFRFGYSPEVYSFLLSAISLSGIIAISLLPRLRSHVKIERLLLGLGGFYTVLFFVMGLPHQWFSGGAVMIFLAITLLSIETLFSQFINLHTREEHRATTLSAVALFTRLPYVLLATLTGRLADNNALPQYTLIVGGVGMTVCCVALFLQRKLAHAETNQAK